MYAQLLRQVRDSLTPENWHKGNFFSRKENKLCMCVHGAAQALVNPQVKLALFKKNKAVRARGHIVVCAEVTRADFFKYNTLHGLWKYRHQYSYINQDFIVNNKNYGNANLHWLMGMFGITFSFNDSPNTTLEMLKEKLTLAAKWAEENEEFLLNN